MENMAFEVRFAILRLGECHGLAPWIVAIVAKERAAHTIHATGLSRGALRFTLYACRFTLVARTRFFERRT